MSKVIVKIPFDGFYNTLHDNAMDREIDNILEDREDDLEISYDDLVIDNTAYMIQYCKNYVDLYNEKFEEATGLKLNLVFEETRSPREYNFANDEIYCTAKLSDLRRMHGFVMINTQRLQAFSDMVVEQCTSRDGFHSFYVNDVKEWPGTDEWDHNHWHLMMLSILGDLAEECLEDTRFYELPNQYVTIGENYENRTR